MARRLGLSFLGLCALLLAGSSPSRAADDLSETREVKWIDPAEPDLLKKATELGSAPAIYEFVRNEFEFAPYDGARSNSISTFLNRRGNDVDLASVLIAMLRSQGVPARYAAGDVEISREEVANWLQVIDPDRAFETLLWAGFSAGVDGDVVFFYHAWVQALVPVENYRGAGPAVDVDCATEPERCVWVDLDPSFKQHRFRDPTELVDVSDAVSFNYDDYYRVEDVNHTPADGLDRREKSPVEIYEEQILQYLRSSHPGKTLEDVVYEGEIEREQHGVLPASPPFIAIPTEVSTYSSVSDHDADPEALQSWTKTVSFTVRFPQVPELAHLELSSGEIPLADLATENLTLAYESIDFDFPYAERRLVVRVGPDERAVLLTVDQFTYTSNDPSYPSGSVPLGVPDIDAPFEITVSMDGVLREPVYPNLTLGGYFLIATGGEHSGWSQVHRSTRRLLEASEEYPVVADETGTLFVDANANGAVDPNEPKLLEDAEAQRALTGNVLAVAKDLYFARSRDAIERVGRLQRTVMPAAGFLGVVSSVHDVQAVDGTAFSITPAGLLVDMKGMTLAGTFKIDQPDADNDRAFRLAGHMLSSLEHEVWQEITGFEAISTMRGIQRAVGDGGTLMLLDEQESQTSVATALANWGFQQNVPWCCSAVELDLFDMRLWLPRTVTPGPLDILRETVDATTSALRRRPWSLELSYDGSTFEPFFRYFSETLFTLSSLSDEASLPPEFDPPYNVATDAFGISDGNHACVTASTVGELRNNLETCFDSIVARPEYQEIEDYKEYFDLNANPGFSIVDHVYRASWEATAGLSVESIAAIRDEVVLGADANGDGMPDPNTTVEFVVPSLLAQGELLSFGTWIQRYFDGSGSEFSSNYIINRAGGGYVSGVATLDPYSGVDPTWNSEVFVDGTLTSSITNSYFGPSTIDPISTVSGNLYHDETDLRIEGRGEIDYLFTRTYNSNLSHANRGGRPMGHGWTHSYNMKLIARDHGKDTDPEDPLNSDGVVSSIIYVDERGGEHVFGVSSGVVSNPRGNFDTLDLGAASSGPYTLRFRNGIEYVFSSANLTTLNAVARLESIRDPHSNQLTLGYDAAGRLTAIADNLGDPARTGLALAYYADGRLQTVADWEGRAWTYTYDVDGHLETVENPLEQVTTYRYADQPSGPAVLKQQPVGLDFSGVDPENLQVVRDGLHAPQGQAATVLVNNDSDRIFARFSEPSAGYTRQRIFVLARGNGGPVDFELYAGNASSPSPEDLLHVGFAPDGILQQFETQWSTNVGHGGWITLRLKSGEAQDLEVVEIWREIEAQPTFEITGQTAIAGRSDENNQETRHWDLNDATFLQMRDGSPTYDAWGVVAFEDTPPELYDVQRIRVRASKELNSICDVGGNQPCKLVLNLYVGDEALPALPPTDLAHAVLKDGASQRNLVAHPSWLPYGVFEMVFETELKGDAVRVFNESDYHIWNLHEVVSRELVTYSARPSRLVAVEKPADRDGEIVRTTFDYYENGRAFSNANSLGEGESLDYDLYRKRTRITAPRNFVTAHFYDEDGELTKLTQPDGSVLTFQHNEDGRRWEKTDGLGYATRYSYCALRTLDGCTADAGGNVTFEKDALDQTIEYDYDLALFDSITRVKDKTGAERVSTYYSATDGATGAAKGKLETVQIKHLTTPSGVLDDVVLERFFYFPNGNLKTHIAYLDPTNLTKVRTTTYVYNASGNNPAQIFPEEITVTDWNDLLRRTTYEIDSFGRIESETLHRRTSRSDPTILALTTQYAHDDLDRLTLTTDPALNQVEQIYDANGKLSQIRRRFWDGNTGQYTAWETVTERKYDAADRLIEEKDVLGQVTTFAYDAAGNLIRVTDPTDRVVRYEYDAMNRQTAVIDANGYRTETAYDLAGNPIRVSDATGRTTVNEYDPLGRLVSVTDPLTHRTEFDYDGEGNLEEIVNANAVADPSLLNGEGASESRHYDELGRLVKIVDALDGETRMIYDLQGNLASVTDAENQVTVFEHDGLGRVTLVRDALIQSGTDRVTTHEYDEAGNRIYTQYRDGLEEEREFDALNRRALSTFPGAGNDVVLEYDDRERLESVSNTEVTYSFTYDAKDRLQTRTDSRFPSQPVIYEYDAADRVIRKTDYQGDVTEMQYDGTGRLAAERNPEYVQVSYQYDGAGRVLTRILSNGARTGYAYDAAGRLESLTNWTADGTQLQRITYDDRDAVGNVKQMTLAHADGTVEVASFEYDRVHRLKDAAFTVTPPGGSPAEQEHQSYAYDQVGNRKTKTSTLSGLPQQSYLYNANNRLTEIRLGSGTGALYKSFDYDDDGNLKIRRNGVGDEELELHYDERNRVTSVDVGGTEVARYAYDPLGYRIEVDGSGPGVRRNLLDAEHLDAAYDEVGNPVATYLRGSVIDEVVNAYTFDSTGKATSYTFHHDSLQSVVGLSGHAGTVEETLRYGPFGELLGQTGTSPSALRFTGRELDAETGLYYYRARYYDPAIGRFLSEDPRGFAGADVNLYAYVGNNPLVLNDPMGECPNCVTAAIGGGVGLLFGGLSAAIQPNASLGSIAAGAALGAASGAVFGSGAGLIASGFQALGLGASVAVFGGEVIATGLAGGSANAITQYRAGNGVNLGQVLAFTIGGTLAGALPAVVPAMTEGFAPTVGQRILLGIAGGEVNFGTDLLLNALLTPSFEQPRPVQASVPARPSPLQPLVPQIDGEFLLYPSTLNSNSSAYWK